MTKDERQQSLTNARLACEWLRGNLTRLQCWEMFDQPMREKIGSLLDEFSRLDAKECKQAAQGEHGASGGRPRKTKLS